MRKTRPCFKLGAHDLSLFDDARFKELKLDEPPKRLRGNWAVNHGGKRILIRNESKCVIPEHNVSLPTFLVQVIRDPINPGNLIAVRKSGHGGFGSIILQTVYPSGKERHLGYTRVASTKKGKNIGEVMRLAVSRYYPTNSAVRVLANATANYQRLKRKYSGIRTRLQNPRFESRSWEKKKQLQDARIKYRVLNASLEKYAQKFYAYSGRATYDAKAFGLLESDTKTLGRLLFYLREEMARKSGLTKLFGDVPEHLFYALHEKNGWVYDGVSKEPGLEGNVACHKDLI